MLRSGGCGEEELEEEAFLEEVEGSIVAMCVRSMRVVYRGPEDGGLGAVVTMFVIFWSREACSRAIRARVVLLASILHIKLSSPAGAFEQTGREKEKARRAARNRVAGM